MGTKKVEVYEDFDDFAGGHKTEVEVEVETKPEPDTEGDNQDETV